MEEYKAALDYIHQLYTALAADYAIRLAGSSSGYQLKDLLTSAEGLEELGKRLKDVFPKLEVKVKSPSKHKTNPKLTETVDKLLGVIRKEELVQFLIRNKLTDEKMTALRKEPIDDVRSLLRHSVTADMIPAMMTEYAKVMEKKSQLPKREREPKPAEVKSEEKKYLSSIKVGGLAMEQGNWNPAPGYYHGENRIIAVARGGREITIERVEPEIPGVPRTPPLTLTYRGGEEWQRKGERSYHTSWKRFLFS